MVISSSRFVEREGERAYLDVEFDTKRRSDALHLSVQANRSTSRVRHGTLAHIQSTLSVNSSDNHFTVSSAQFLTCPSLMILT